MTTRPQSVTARLRRAEWPAIFAVWAVLLQLAFVTLHIAAQSRLLGDEARAPGFVLYCLHPGLTSGAQDSGANGPGGAPTSDGGACPVCASSACQASLTTPVAPMAPAPPPVVRALVQIPPAATPPRARTRVGSARGPPSSLAS